MNQALYQAKETQFSNGRHSLRAHCVPGTVLSALQTLSRLIFPEHLCCYYHFTDKETEAPRGKVTHPRVAGLGFEPR